jgi:integrase/recombinase XerD
MHSVPEPARVRFSGPLAVRGGGVGAGVVGAGLRDDVSDESDQLQLAAYLSGWLDREGVDPHELTEELLDRFLVERRREYTSHYSRRALGPIIGHLRTIGVVPEVVDVAPASPAQVLLAQFAGDLKRQRALSTPVVTAYLHWVGPFVEQVLCPVGVERPRDVSAVELGRSSPTGCR